MSGEISIIRTELIAKLDGGDLKIALALQSFANKQDRGWVFAYPWQIAEIAGVDRSTVTRRLNAMYGAGVIERRERKAKRAGRKSYEYRLRLSRGDESTAEALQDNESASAHIQPANVHERTSKCADPHFGSAPAALPRKQTVLTKKDLSEPTVLRESSGDGPTAEEFWAAASQPMRDRSSKKLVRTEVARIPIPKRIRALAGLRAYLENDEDVAAGRGQPALHRWLRDARYEPWCEAAEPASAGWGDAQWAAAARRYAADGTWKPDWPPRESAPAQHRAALGLPSPAEASTGPPKRAAPAAADLFATADPSAGGDP